MLAIGFKLSDTSAASLRSSLSDFLRREYDENERQVENHEGMLDQFLQLKTNVDLVRTPSSISRHVLLRYYAQLDRMVQRFSCDGEGAGFQSLRLQFTWNDSFCPRKKSTQTGLSYEKAAVMFNVGALESQLGVQIERNTARGLKAACHHFMKAAGAFTEVKDFIVKQTLGTGTADMSAEGLSLLIYLMLAQAQACFYEKAIKDQLKDGIKAKLVHQALEYYVSALEFCRSSGLVGAIDKSWEAHLQFQAHCMRAATQFWQGKASKAIALERGEGYGEEIARLGAADAECTKACKVATENKLPSSLLESAQTLQRVVGERLVLAKKDNVSVYLANVPEVSTLPAVGKAAMVKPLVFTSDELLQDLGGVDLFEQYVPKDLLLRADSVKQDIQTLFEETAENVSKSTTAANKQLKDMGLPASIEAYECDFPKTLWRRILYVKDMTASIDSSAIGANKNPVVAFIQQQLQAVTRISDDAEKQLYSAEMLLNEEEMEDKVCRQKYGESVWAQPLSSSLNQNFRFDIDRYYRLLKESKKSDATIREKVYENENKLEALAQSKSSLKDELPKLSRDKSNSNEEIAEISSFLMRLGQLVEEKDQLLRQFKESFDKFSALPVLLGGEKLNAEAALEAEKQFFKDHFSGKITLIFEEEQTVLDGLMQANSHFEANKETDHLLRERQAFFQNLSDAVDVFEQLESHVKEGAKFYSELSIRVAQLHQTVEDHCSARALERRELEMNLTASEEMRQREAADAALAQKMMADMRVCNDGGFSSTRDEALARQLAGSTPQHYPVSCTTQQTAPRMYETLQSQPQQTLYTANQQPHYGYVLTSSISAPSYEMNARQHPAQQQNYHQYPGQQRQDYDLPFSQGHMGDSV
ncbi:hypothetical protein CCR75_003230 [Bremia lactucae]|uniref:BRO1 domain-containing protein n=1 Tax=Bremia lactucae TaxID=4779 RepID=A0A976FKF1_BRELC|nr:hypothetical protein CCR75_003230 [Bremia lactucae]